MEIDTEIENVEKIKEVTFSEIENEEEDNDHHLDETENFQYIENTSDIPSSSYFVSVTLPTLQKTEKDSDLKVSWTREMTYDLIKEYKSLSTLFTTPEKKKKETWKMLADRLQKKGYNVDWNMCDRKFRNLKSTYRQIYYSKRSESNKRRWEFYEDLHELIPPATKYPKVISPPDSLRESQNYIHPDSTPTFNKISNISVLKENASNKFISILPKPINNKPKIYQTIEISTNNLQNNLNETPDWFLQFLNQFKSDQEKMFASIQKMQNESKQIELRKIKLLEEILSMLKDKQ